MKFLLHRRKRGGCTPGLDQQCFWDAHGDMGTFFCSVPMSPSRYELRFHLLGIQKEASCIQLLTLGLVSHKPLEMPRLWLDLKRVEILPFEVKDTIVALI